MTTHDVLTGIEEARRLLRPLVEGSTDARATDNCLIDLSEAVMDAVGDKPQGTPIGG